MRRSTDNSVQSKRQRSVSSIVTMSVIAAVAVLIIVLVAYRAGLLAATSTAPDELQPSESGPIQYVAVPEVSRCDGQVVAARQINETWAITRIENSTLSAIKNWGGGRSLTDIYQEIINSEQFIKLSNSHRWIIASWSYGYFNGRPEVEGNFIVPNRDNTVATAYLKAFYYFDDYTKVSRMCSL